MSFECIHPLTACVVPEGSYLQRRNKDKSRLIWSRVSIQDEQTGEVYDPYLIPCGKCFNCRMRRSHDWAIRLRMEMASYENNQAIFLTLTYDDLKIRFDQKLYRNLCTSDGLTLYHPDFQRFINNLRHALPGVELRYFMAGEYGDKLQRPHFHVILFGYDFFEGASIYQRTEDGYTHYTHPILSSAWNKGIAEFGAVSLESISYVSGYVLKKQGKSTLDYGERKPPYICMSRRPGIGSKFVEDHFDDFLKSGYLYLDGEPVSVPRSLLESFSKDHFDKDGKLLRPALISERDLIRYKDDRLHNMELVDRQYWREHPFDNSVSRMDKERFLADLAEQRYKIKHLLQGGEL